MNSFEILSAKTQRTAKLAKKPRVAALQEQARSLGLFPGDRDLLDCPKCGLMEDVLIGGKLITYHAGGEGEDTGLRFEELAERNFRCPGCRSVVQER